MINKEKKKLQDLYETVKQISQSDYCQVFEVKQKKTGEIFVVNIYLNPTPKILKIPKKK